MVVSAPCVISNMNNAWGKHLQHEYQIACDVHGVSGYSLTKQHDYLKIDHKPESRGGFSVTSKKRIRAGLDKIVAQATLRCIIVGFLHSSLNHKTRGGREFSPKKGPCQPLIEAQSIKSDREEAISPTQSDLFLIDAKGSVISTPHPRDSAAWRRPLLTEWM